MTSNFLAAHRSIVSLIAIFCLHRFANAQDADSLAGAPEKIGIFRLYDLTNTKIGEDGAGRYGIDRLMILRRGKDGKVKGSAYPAERQDNIWEIDGNITLPGSIELNFRSKSGATISRILEYFPDNGNLYTRNFKSLLDVNRQSSSESIAPTVARFQRAELCDEKCVVVLPTDNSFRGFKSISFAEFFGVSNEVSFGPTVNDFRAVAKDSIDAFRSYVLFFGGKIDIEGKTAQSYHVRSTIPAMMSELYEANLRHSKMLAIDADDCQWKTEKHDFLICKIRDRVGLQTKTVIFSLEYDSEEHHDRLKVASDLGNDSSAEDIKYLYAPRTTETSAPLTSALVKVIFDRQTFITGDLGTASGRASLNKSLKAKLLKFCALVAKECSVSSGESSGTALNLEMIGNSSEKKVFSDGYWWKVTIEFIFSSELDLSDQSRSFDTVQLHFQHLNLAKSPVDNPPPDGAWRSLPTVLENGGDANSNGNPVPDLVRDMADKLADLYKGARLSSVTSDFSSPQE